MDCSSQVLILFSAGRCFDFWVTSRNSPCSLDSTSLCGGWGRGPVCVFTEHLVCVWHRASCSEVSFDLVLVTPPEQGGVVSPLQGSGGRGGVGSSLQVAWLQGEAGGLQGPLVPRRCTAAPTSLFTRERGSPLGGRGPRRGQEGVFLAAPFTLRFVLPTQPFKTHPGPCPSDPRAVQPLTTEKRHHVTLSLARGTWFEWQP